MSMINELMLRTWATVQGLLGRLHDDERGQGLAEYVVTSAIVITIVGIILWGVFQGALQGAVANLATAIGNAVAGA